MDSKGSTVLPAEWEPQAAIQLTWPHPETDWAPYLAEAVQCFKKIADAVLVRQALVIVCPDPSLVRSLFSPQQLKNISFFSCQSNDTWARDHAGITVRHEDQFRVIDFKFNGWGLKFPANLDNQITACLLQKGLFGANTQYENQGQFVLEGGAIESDGQGTLLTTTTCLCSPNRNETLSRKDIEQQLKNCLGADRVLWLEHGYLAGDDTDSHIDTLARFCSPNRIAYVQCKDPKDEHFDALSKMEKELQTFLQRDGQPYQLIPLPMADPVYHNGERLPATYANFLIINGSVLLPFYQSAKDQIAKKILEEVFPNREIIGINCLPLIRQHGSLHCISMQYPKGSLSF